MFYNFKHMQVPDFDMREPMKKAVPYSIIPIGDKEALLAWRKDQALLAEARDAYLKPIRQATRDRVVAMVANQNADITPDQVSLAEAKHLQARSKKSLKTDLPPTPEPSPRAFVESRGGVSEVIKGALAALWDATGFYK